MGAPALLFGADLVSHEYSGGASAPSGYVSLGTPDALYPGTNLNNGSMAVYARAAGTSAFAIDLRRAISPDFAFAFNTNFDEALEVRFQGSAAHDFSTLHTNVLVTGSGPHRWVDMRTLNPTARQFWRWYASGDSLQYACGEVVIATESAVTPYVQWGFADDVYFAATSQGTTPLGSRVRRSYGAKLRKRSGLRVQGTRAYVQRIIDSIYAVQDYNWPLAFIPDVEGTDCWWVELQGLNIEYPGSNLRRVTFALVEQGGGVVDA